MAVYQRIGSQEMLEPFLLMNQYRQKENQFLSLAAEVISSMVKDGRLSFIPQAPIAISL
jgi:hypothetical protein